MRLYAIGDVHGRLDLLEAMHRAIAAEIARERPLDWRVVHLGDYVDRGPDSRGVVELLIAARTRDPRHVLLAGNHEEGLLTFLAAPDENGLFMRNGGVETARSYGVALDAGSVRPGRDQLAAAMPTAHVDFLAGLPCSFEAGDFFFCHAGIRPGVALRRQIPRDLMWIREEFLTDPRLHEKVIVHGHTPVRHAEIRANRVNLDSYAWDSGRLSALAVDGPAKRLLAVSEDGSVQGSEAVTP